MAARRKATSIKTAEFAEVEKDLSTPLEMTNKPNEMPDKKMPKWVYGLAIVVLAVVGFWWKTNTWPVVAMVGTHPVTRYEIEQNLFKQYGQSAVEGIVTQYQIETQLDKLGVKVDSKDVDARIEEIKKSLGPGQDLNNELASRGMDVTKFKNLITLQLRLNKAVEGKASVSAEKITAYVKENGKFLAGKNDDEKKVEAEKALKQEAMNSEVDKWVAEAKKAISVWRLYPEPTQPAGNSGQPQVQQ